MGSGSYDTQARTLRASASGYATARANDSRVFVQADKRCVNEGMDPRLVTGVRECRDNADHPNTIPVILALDVTGSMGRIPVRLIQHELPVLMTSLLALHPDVALMFMAVGDDRCDQGPLQVGQFEASDALLDHWLTRTWIEGDGGGNGGESYALPWLFSANKVVTDAWDKRHQKGLLITVGDEPIHSQYFRDNLQKVFGPTYNDVVSGFEGSTLLHQQIHRAASERWNIHHIALGYRKPNWDILGEQCHVVASDSNINAAIVSVFQNHLSSLGEEVQADPVQPSEGTPETPNAPNPIPAPL